VKLGANGGEVARLGLGCMGTSGMYGQADERESIATIHAALDAGINLLDTGDFYGMGHNELLISRALESRERPLISVKFGAQRGPDGAWLGYDARPQAVKTALAYSLNRLRVDHIDIYRPARLDPNVPIEETVGAIAELVQTGYVRHVGLSEVGAETIRRAAAVHPICDLQIEYSRQNQELVDQLRAIAADKGASPAQLAIAWVLSRGDEDIVPLIGARRRDQLTDALGALELQLTDEELERIAQAVPAQAVAGTRYDEAQMAHLDSER
jgi:pyridoxine 4-dehydrogenase